MVKAHSLFIILPSYLAFFNRNTCRTARFIPSLEKIITTNRNYSSLFYYDDLILDLLILKISRCMRNLEIVNDEPRSSDSRY